MAMLEEPIKGVKIVKNYINGEWVESKGKMVDVVNPATTKTIAKGADFHRRRIQSAPSKPLKRPSRIGAGLLRWPGPGFFSD